MIVAIQKITYNNIFLIFLKAINNIKSFNNKLLIMRN